MLCFVVFTLAKAKHLRDENKNGKMNRFLNDFMTNLSEEEKKVPFLTNQARALRAYSEGSVQRVSIYRGGRVRKGIILVDFPYSFSCRDLSVWVIMF